MKKKLMIVAAALLAATAMAAGIRPFADRERVAFLGDSITAFNHYIAEAQLYMDCARGAKAPYFMNCGTAGDGVWGAQDRIDCDLMTMRPDRVIVMLGMNDNGYDSWKSPDYTPFMRKRHEQRRDAYKRGMTALVEKLIAHGLKVDIMTPSPYDEYSTDLKRPAYTNANEVGLSDFAEVCRKIAAEKGLGLVEIHRPMTAVEKNRRTGLHYSGGDRVHPGAGGNRFIAAAVLAAAGEVPDSALTPDGVEALFAKGDKMQALRKALTPVRKEMERIRALVYCDRFVKGMTGKEVDLADIAPAAAAVVKWVDGELAKGTDPARAARLKDIRATYASVRVQVPALQRDLEALHRKVVSEAIPSIGTASDSSYGNYGAVERLRSISVDENVGDATMIVPVATGAGEIVVSPPRPNGRTVYAADFGFSVTNDDNGAAIQRALDAAKKAKAGRLVLAPGVYRCFGPKGVMFDGFEDFVFDGAGAELVFRRPPTYPIVPSWHHDTSRANFVIRNCRRMRMGGFDMDWDWRTAPLATGARVTKIHVDETSDFASYVEFELLGHGDRHPYFGTAFPVQHLNQMSADFSTFGERNSNWWMGTYEGDMGAKSEWIDPVHVRVYPSVFDRSQPHWGGPNAVSGNAKANRAHVKMRHVGEHVRIAHRYYGKGGFTLDSNEDLELHDVNVYACFGFGVYIDGSQRNWILRNVRFKPRDLRHPISCSADTIHFSHSMGGAIIDGLQTSHGQDDVINVHDRFTVAKPVGERELEVILKRGAIYFMPGVGHEVELRFPTFHATGWRGKVVAIKDSRIVFDRPLPAAGGDSSHSTVGTGPYFLVFDRSASCDRVIVRNAVIEDNEQRCLFNASDITIENCVFRRTNGDAVRLLADYTMTYWCEGTGVTNLVVRNCRFENNCMGHQLDCPWNMGADLVTCLGLPPNVRISDADKSHVSRILVEGCTFRDSLSYAAAFNFGRDIVFRRNSIECTGLRGDRLPTSGSIRLRHVSNICFEGNRFVVPRGGRRPVFEIGEDVSNLALRGNFVCDAPKVVFSGAINGVALAVFEKAPDDIGWEAEVRADASKPWSPAAVEVKPYPWNIGWRGRPVLRVPLKGAAELRVRARRNSGTSQWVDLGRLDPGRSACDQAVGDLFDERHGPDNLFDGRLDTLFEAQGNEGWCGQTFADPVEIRAVRFVARFAFVTGGGTDRAEGAFIECSDDDSFDSPRRIAVIGKVREDAVNEIVFEKPVTARAFRIVKPHGAVLDLLELAFVPVRDVVPSTTPRGIVRVSPKGDDRAGDGSRAKPFRTLERALAAVRKLPAPRMVELMPGDYQMTKTLELDARDAGLCVRAVGGRACLRGDRRLVDWKADGDGLFAADVPEVRDGADGRTLFVSGAFAPRAELPGGGGRFKMRNDPKDLKMRSSMEGFWSRKPTDLETRSLKYDPKDIGPGFDARNAEVRVFHVWSESLCGVASNVVAENRLWFPKAIPPLGIWNRKDYIVYNTREGMKEPGQWYLDRTRGKVVYRPRPGEDIAKLDIRFPVVQTLLRIRKAKGVVFKGLSFTGTTPPLMRAGFAGLDLPGAVEFVGACPDVRLDRLSFDHIGGTALKVGSDNGRVSRCRFTDIGCVAAVASGANFEFVSNVVQRFGVAYQSGCGVMTGGKGSHVWRNTVSDGPYSGFLVYSDSVYEENRVMRVMRELSDGAAFYGGVRNSVFRNNIVSDVHTIKGGYGGCGFYCDEGSQNNLYENNITTDVGLPIHMHMGRGQIVRNNTFVIEGNIHLSFQGSRDCVFEGNRVCYSGTYSVASPDAIGKWKNNTFFGPWGSREEPPPEVPVQPVKRPEVKSSAPGYRFSLDRDAEGRIYGSSPMNGDMWWDAAGLHIRLRIIHMMTDKVAIGKVWGEGDGVRFTVNGRVFDRMAERQEKGRPHYDIAADFSWPEIGLEPKPGLEVPFNAQVRITAIDQCRYFESPNRQAVLRLQK